MKFTNIIGWIRAKEKWIDASYYSLYAILYLSALVGTTTFMEWEHVPTIRNLVYMGATAGILILWVLGLVLQENWKINAAKIVILAAGMLQFVLGGGSSLILILTILIGATDRKSASVILRESLIIGISVLIIAYIASMNGYIAYKVSTDGRHSFGFTYYSHFSDKLLYLFMIFRCLYRKRMSMVGYAMTAMVICLDYRYTHARTVTICFVLFLILCGIYDLVDYIREIRCKSEMKTTRSIGSKRSIFIKLLFAILSASYMFACALSVFGIYLYKIVEKMEIPSELNTFMARIIFSNEAMNQYGCTLFGQKIYESLSSGSDGPYFYLDNSYIRLLFITGVVTLAFFVFFMTWLMWKMVCEKRYIMFFALLVAAVGGISETYTINFYYNVFIILGFAHLGRVGMLDEKDDINDDEKR